jgi:hypothetical protein
VLGVFIRLYFPRFPSEDGGGGGGDSCRPEIKSFHRIELLVLFERLGVVVSLKSVAPISLLSSLHFSEMLLIPSWA